MTTEDGTNGNREPDNDSVDRDTMKGHAMSTRTTAVAVACSALFALCLLAGCAGAMGNVTASDPIERGLSYVAAAIVTHGILQALFNK
jgi:hypothetical protein